jgi:hypothetical protein
MASNTHRFGPPTDNLVSIAEKRKYLLTYTQETIRAKLE